MSAEWIIGPLGEMLTFQRGFDITKAEQHDGPYPVISSSGPNSTHSEYKMKAPGVIIGRKGSLGTVFYADSDYWPHDTTLWVKDFHGNDPKFAYYFLQTMHFEQYDTGASNPTLNRNHIHLLEVCYPPLNIQRRVASILSAYDDLIENNTQRIAALEAAAQALYREWFVEMRFPNHESARWVESEMGVIPEGWELSTVDAAFEITGGGTPSTKEPAYWDGDINWYAPSDLTATGTVFMRESPRKITVVGLRGSSARMFPAYSVMMTSRATLGVVALNTTEACTNQGFITCIPNERVSAYQIYFWILDNSEQIDNAASGATFKEITKGNFRQFPFLIANQTVHQRFVEAVEPLFGLIENLEHRNVVLRETRDLLLPRLISGEVSVEALRTSDEILT